MHVICPLCGTDIDVTDKLPERACDSETIDCECGAELEIGWTAEAEIRSHKQP